jgi:putative sigma-54 modulation protein
MNVKISFQHLEHTEALDDKIREKSEKLDKYFSHNPTIKWSCQVKDQAHCAEINLHGPRGVVFHAKAKSDCLYKTIDLALNKLEKQINKKQKQAKNRIHRQIERPVILDYESAWADYDEDYYKDVA